jgi:photosynthetic reaction center M subunit
MADYQNLFTTVQAHGPVHHGVGLGPGNSPRTGHPAIYWILGRSVTHNWVLSTWVVWDWLHWCCGLIAFTIIGMNMLASVHYDPVQFVRQLFWLALEPPLLNTAWHGRPLNQGGWFLILWPFPQRFGVAVVGRACTAALPNWAWARMWLGHLQQLYG